MLDKIDAPSFNEEDLPELTDLYDAILTMKNPRELNMFFADLCSVNELHSFLGRWKIVRRIEQGKSYEDIINEMSKPDNPGASSSDSIPGAVCCSDYEHHIGRVKGKPRNDTKISSATISRVKRCYQKTEGGYRTALKRLEEMAENKKETEE
ncbi:MAG: Trp family transcriptional regulator [Mageeibacillus sp.]|nr:Trp family transcriptional regulator [Mageeibacillus sp.]MCI1263364.1 Trp family transcriptional regulator [Saccharofermentans sp.]MCI2043960.1 Trp family transcriptional regulator [Mageeibacillus sp.]